MKTKIITLCLVLYCAVLHAQNNDDQIQNIRTDANLNSGNYRDILTNFFQLAFNDLTGDDKRFRFSSNLFAIKLKTNPELNVDHFYKNQTFWRNSNIDVDLKLADKFKFNGISFGYKYALCNRRDHTVSRHLTDMYKLRVENFNQLREYLSMAIAKVTDRELKKALTKELSDFFGSEDVVYKDLSDDLKKLIDQFYGSEKVAENFSFRQSVNLVLDSLIDSYKNKLLWTASLNFSTLDNGLLQDGIVKTQATAGLLKLNHFSNIEFDLQASLTLNRDSLGASQQLNQIWKGEGGLNYVHRNSNQVPVLEIKAGSTYYSAPKQLQMPEFTFDGGIRLRVTKSLWVPLTVKYDPQRANVFGYLSVKSNFDWLTGLLGDVKFLK